MEGKSNTPSKATLPVVPNERTNIGGQLWGHGRGAIIEEAVTSIEEELILGLNLRISLYPFSTPLTIPLPNDPVRPLKKPSLKPLFLAHFFTKFIVLGLLGLGLLTSTVKDLLN